MRSPAYPDTNLELKEIEPGLSAYVCPQSGGVWIPLSSYLAWQATHKIAPAGPPKEYAPAPADDSKRRAMLCPESGRFLIRYKVGHGLNFHVDVSPVTGGIWLDKGEWEALKSKGLHIELNNIFTASYQRKVRTEEYVASLDQAFRDRIGPADFQKVAEFKIWLEEHPKRRDIWCYLSNNSEENKE